MSDYDKPPLGCAPSYIPACDRIADLSIAICRNSSTAEYNLGHIRKWATEILAQCDIIEKFYDQETMRSEYLKSFNNN